MAGVPVPIQAGLDQGSFKRAADDITRVFGAAGKEASASFGKSFDTGAKAAKDAAKSVEKAYDSIADAAGRTKTAEAERQRQMEKAKSLADQLAAAEKKVANARTAGDAKAQSSAERELNSVRDKLAATNTAIVRSSEAAERNRRAEVRATRDAVSAYRELESAQRQAQTSLAKGPRGPGFLSGLTSQSSGIVGQFSNLGTGAGKGFVAGAAAAILAGGLVAIGAKAAGMVMDGFKSVMDTGLDFERTVNNFRGVTEASETEARRMSATARQLGSDTTLAGASASDAAQAMTELAKAGFSVDQAMAASRGTLQLATAGQLEAAQAAEIQANAMNAFGLDKTLDNSARVADVLANAAVGSSADIGDLALALQQVGGISYGFGNSLEDTTAALAMFANAGIKGSDAGTLLKTTLQSITDQGNPAQEAINNLGLSLYNFDTGQFVGFRELFRQLDEARARMSPEAFQAQTNILFGSDAMRSAMLGNAQTFDQMVGIIGRVGTASQMAEAQMRGLPGVVEGISNSMESLKLGVYDAIGAIGDQMGPGLVSGFEGVGNWVNTHQSEIIGFITSFVDQTAFWLDGIAGFVSGSIRLFGMWVNTIADSTAQAVNLMGNSAKEIGFLIAKVPGMKDLGTSIAAAGIKAAAVGTVMSTFGDGAIQVADGIDRARESGRGFANDIIEAGKQAQVAAALTDALGGAMATIPDGKTITIESNSPEVQKRVEELGFKVERLPTGQMTIVPNDAEARKVYDAWVQQTKNPIVIEVKARVDDYNMKLMAWINAVKAGQNPGPMPAPPQAGMAPSAPATPVFTPPVGTGGGFSSGAGGGSSSSTSLPEAPVLPLQYTDTQGLADQVASAQTQLDEAQHALAEKRARVQQLEQSNVATAEDLQKARNDVTKAEQDELQANKRLQDAKTEQYKKLTEAGGKAADKLSNQASQLGQIGAQLDQDFGISKGLAGIAENVTKFVGNLIAAPFLTSLAAVTEANPSKGGHGLLGILGAQGAFGPQFTGIEPETTTSAPSFSAASDVPQSKFSDANLVPAAARLNDIIAAYFPSVERIGGYRQDAHPDHPSGRALDIMIPGGTTRGGKNPAGKALGDQMWAFLNANAATLGFDPQGSLWQTDTGGDHFDHIHARIKEGMEGAVTGAFGAATAPGSSLWDAVAKFESGGNWSNADTGNNGHYGGLQFSPETWKAFGGGEFAPMPHQASREQQIAVANRTAFTGYNGTPPQGLGAWEVITNGSVPGVTTSTPASAFMTGAPTGTPAVTAVSAPAPSGFGSGIPIPLPVTIVGGGFSGGPLGAPIGTPASGVGLGPAPGPVPGGGVPTAGGPGTGAGFPGMAGPPAGPTQIGGFAPGGNAAGGGGGGVGITPGGTIDMAMQAGGMALDALAPGAGQAAATGMKLANRAIQYGAQAASIGVSGLMETFLPTGGSELANNNWFTRILGGIAGAAPALPNMAGQKAPPPPNGAEQQQHQGSGQPPGPAVVIENMNNTKADGMGVANDIAWHQTASNTGGGMGR